MATIFGYIGPTPITEYGCVRCQKWHRLGIDPEYDAHIMDQSKHGPRKRAPEGTLETFVAKLLADKSPQPERNER